IYVITQKYILQESTIVIEEIIAKVRTRLSDKIRKVDLLSLETIGKTQIYNRLTQETIIISTSGPILIFSIQSAVMLLFVSLYILTISKTAFLLIVTVIGGGVAYYLYGHKKFEAKMKESNQSEMSFFRTLTDSLDGMKEIKLNRKRNDGVYAHLKGVAGTLQRHKTETNLMYFNNAVFAQSFYYMLIGVMVFVLPRLHEGYSDTLSQLTAAVLFMMGPVGIIVNAIQTFAQVDFAVSNIYNLEEHLEKAIETFELKDESQRAGMSLEPFKEIRLRDLEFAYKDTSGNGGFSVGPFDFEIKAGETLFIVGGNGSGKTTFLKLLSMLYYPDKGTISVDQEEVGLVNASNYREMFSAIFSDFHLFARLHILSDGNWEKVMEYLKTMEIDHKTNFNPDEDR
ncbi:MAG: ATP-binding cassette domain-containing protein, partial [bacterium]|nr:ATP-binding cassette domain-containing protein [bacterium]